MRPPATQVIAQLARRWRRRQLVRLGAEALGAALVGAVGVGALAGWPLGVRAIVFLASATAVAYWRGRRAPGPAERERLVARHLDRLVPEAEDSCELLVTPAAGLSGVARLQRARVARALEPRVGSVSVPHRPLSAAALIGTAAVALTAALVLLSSGTAVAGAGAVPEAGAGADRGAPGPVVPTGIDVEVVPPAYTGKPPHASTSLDVTAEDGATVRWALTFDRDITNAMLVFASGDTVSLAASAGRYTGRIRARQPDVYTLVVEGADGAESRSRFHVLAVIEDLPPGIRVITPARQRSTTGSGATIEVRAALDDDYGLSDAALLATLARGTGENVRFREVQIPFEQPARQRERVTERRASLDLAALGMEPGDELYFFITARDRRVPEPNVSRSETYFLVVPDTGVVPMASAEGIAVSLLPEYFRSQRQIIIDTERLIAERGSLAPAEVARRSNNIGLDQKALRLRYGQFVGEESNAGIVGGDIGEGEDEHEAEGPAAAGGMTPADSALAPFTHTHDVEAIATFFSEEVRERLKAVLAEMWDAELRLRTARPDAALPYEYRALALLKALQEAARVYVLRVGFEPPPLRPEETRLSGELDDVRDRTARWSGPAGLALPDVRNALAVLARMDQAGAGTPQDTGALERAGRELARAAIDDPVRYVDPLNALRRLIDEIAAGVPACRACITSARRALWGLLPSAPAPAARAGHRHGAVAERYYELLGQER